MATAGRRPPEPDRRLGQRVRRALAHPLWLALKSSSRAKDSGAGRSAAARIRTCPPVEEKTQLVHLSSDDVLHKDLEGTYLP
jgi:hypothetical protein